MSALLYAFFELVGMIFHPRGIFPKRTSRRDLIIFANLRRRVNCHLYASAHRKKINVHNLCSFLIYCESLYVLSICIIDDMEINV